MFSCAILISYEGDFILIRNGKQKNFFYVLDVMLFQYVHEPNLTFLHFPQRFSLDLTVYDANMGKGLRIFGENGELPIGLQNGVIHVGKGCDVLESELAEQIVQRKAHPLHFRFLQNPSFDDDAWLSVQKLFGERPFGCQKGKNDLRGNDGEDGNDCVQKGNGGVGQRNGCKLRKQKGCDKLGDLHFTDLPFPGKPQRQDQDQIDQNGSDENCRQKNTSLPLINLFTFLSKRKS